MYDAKVLRRAHLYIAIAMVRLAGGFWGCRPSEEVVRMPNIDGVERALREAAGRGDFDRAEADAAVERWRAAEAALDLAAEAPMPERDGMMKDALAEYNDSTAEVWGLMNRVG